MGIQANYKILKYSEKEIDQWEKDTEKYRNSGELINSNKLQVEKIYFLVLKGENWI